jgi:hypothetical protein
MKLQSKPNVHFYEAHNMIAFNTKLAPDDGPLRVETRTQ